MTAALIVLGGEARAETWRRLTDFPAGPGGLTWQVVNDNVMGGRSTGGYRMTETSLLFTGRTNTNGGGFSSIRSTTQPFTLGAYDGIRLRVRGDGRRYTFRLTTTDSRRGRMRPSYWAEFPTRAGSDWEIVDVPFSRFSAQWRGRRLAGPTLDPNKIDSLGLMIYDKRDGPFRLEVDWIRAYENPAPFSLSDYRWKKRPLLLFAPTAEDPRLMRQMETIRTTRDAFEERDMVLVVVLGRGGSKAGGDPLSNAAADALRRRYGVSEQDFAVRLVGKDGGVKREEDQVAPMLLLYTQIDQMPMRKAELRRSRLPAAIR